MEINAKKTKVMVFGTKHTTKNQILKICHGRDYLENVTEIKYLGVTLDQSLSWTPHILNVTNKINRVIACTRRIKSYLNQSLLKHLYYSLMLPHIDYCSVVWGKCKKKDLLKLQRTQNRYARLADYLTPKDILLSTLQWQSVENRIDYHYCIFVYKILNNLAPYYLEPFACKRPVYYVTRHSTLNPLFIPKPKTEFKKRSFSFIAPSIYNNLPTHIRTATSLQMFKKQIKSLPPL